MFVELTITQLNEDGKFALKTQGVEAAPYTAEEVLEQVLIFVGLAYAPR